MWSQLYTVKFLLFKITFRKMCFSWQSDYKLNNFCVLVVNQMLNIDVNESFMEQYINVICHLDVKVMSNFISEMWFTRNNIIFQK